MNNGVSDIWMSGNSNTLNVTSKLHCCDCQLSVSADFWFFALENVCYRATCERNMLFHFEDLLLIFDECLKEHMVRQQ
jgi:hypothetical protein